MRRIFLSFFLFVIVTMMVLNFAFNPVAGMLADRMLAKQVDAYYGELIKGTFHMLVVDLERLPEGRWAGRIEALQPEFGYPINLIPVATADLTADERAKVMAHQVVVKSDGELFYLRVGDSHHLLFMGPIQDPKLDLFNLYLILWGCVVLIVALLTLIWALPFWRKLQRISAAAAAFGDGRLDARAAVPRRSALAPLAESFNRMADRIQELIAAQRELTNAVSHELRTPIARIRFGLEMLASATKIGDRKHYLQELGKDADELDALVTESLTYARFDHGAPGLAWQARPLDTWVGEVAQASLHGLPPVEFSVENRLSPPHREVFLEPRYMARAVGNLMQNAAKHAAGRVVVILEVDGDACCIHVDDDGEGIPPADRHRVFQPFTRLDSSRSRASGGHGLGLAIVRRVVLWHGGLVRVDDAPLGGARLTLCWPGLMPPKANHAD